MGGAVFHRDRALAPVAQAAPAAARPLPRGYGLLIGAGVSLGLWAGVAFGVAKFLS